MKRLLILGFKVAISAGLLWYIFSKINILLLWQTVLGGRASLVVASAALAFVGVFLSVLKWDQFLRNYGVRISRIKLYSLYSISTFFNNFLPTTIGGDAYRFARLSANFPLHKKGVASSIILERFSGFFVIFVINVCCVPFFLVEISNNRALLLMEGLAVSAFALVCLAIFLAKRLVRFGRAKTSNRIAIKALNLLDSLYHLSDRNVLLVALIYSLLFILLVSVARAMVFWAFGWQVPFIFLLFSASLIQLVGILPISLNSIGVTEGLSVFLYSLAGVPPELSVVVALVGRASLMVTSSIGGLFYFVDEKIKY